MKRIALMTALLFGFSNSAFAADPVEGLWKTQVDDGAFAYVVVAQCGTALCGVISRTFNDSGEYKSPNIGKNLVWDMHPKKNPGKYGGGKIWQPSTDKIFMSKMTLKGNVLKVAGCVAGGLICKKQTWTRVQ